MIERLKERTGGQSSCVQMFLCKISPVIAAVQQSSAEAISGLVENSLEDTRLETEIFYRFGLNIFIAATYWWIWSNNSFLTQNNLSRTAEIVKINIRLAN